MSRSVAACNWPSGNRLSEDGMGSLTFSIKDLRIAEGYANTNCDS